MASRPAQSNIVLVLRELTVRAMGWFHDPNLLEFFFYICAVGLIMVARPAQKNIAFVLRD